MSGKILEVGTFLDLRPLFPSTPCIYRYCVRAWHMASSADSIAQENIADPPLLGGKRLRGLLGFESGEAFRAAIRTGRVPVALFKIPGRKGWFAQSDDVSAWLSSLRQKG